MKTEKTPHDWDEFLEKIQAGYRHLHWLERELTAIPEEAWHGAQADALRQELVRAAVEVVSREDFMEHCRRQGEPVPHLKWPQGSA